MIVEIRTAPGTDQEKMKNMIFEKTGFLPSITENGTNYVPQPAWLIMLHLKSFSFSSILIILR
jgi:hypothetical protein